MSERIDNSGASPLGAMAMSYLRSRAIGAAARLGVADALGDSECGIGDLAARCGANEPALRRLLRALAGIGIVVERAPGRFALTPMGQPLRKDAPNSEWAVVVFWSDLLADSWAHLTECIRTGEKASAVMERAAISSRWSTAPDSLAIFQAVMGSGASEACNPIVRAHDFSGCRVVADLGGGGGALLSALLKTFPNMRGMLVERPHSIAGAAARFEREGLASRCQAIGADLCENVPSGADIYMTKHVLHGYDDAAAARILRNCRAAMQPDGRLLIIEFVLPDIVDRATPELEQRLMHDLNMLAVTGGRERSAAEWRSLLADAGLACRNIRQADGDSVSIIEAALR